MKNKKIAKLSIALGLSCVTLIGGISAYFTDGDTATNEFTIGKVSLKLEEPSWTPPTNITPNQEIDKDPQILNDGVNDEFVFMEVKVPYANIVVASDDGTRQEAVDTELFSYTINSGWTEIGTPVKADGVVTHLYAYGTTDACTALAKDGKTPALFNSVTFCNAIEDQGLEESTKEIIINAYGIQTNNVNGNKTDASGVWNVIKNQRGLTSEGGSEQPPVETTATLMTGSNFNNLLKTNFPNATSIEFVKESKTKTSRTIPEDAIDFSVEQDGSILGYQEENTVYIASGSKILANADSSKMFDSRNKLTSIDFTNFDTSNVTDMSWMFSSCSNLTNLDLGDFNTSNVTDMSFMFRYCSSLSSLKVNNFNTSNVSNMKSMFSNCSSLTNLNVSNWNTSQVNDMSFMFADSGITSLDLSSFNTFKVTNMSSMFQYCSGLTNLNVSNFDTSNVTNMKSMFYDCSNLSELNLNNFNTSNVTNMSWMFYNCSGLIKLDVSTFDTSKVTDMSGMFQSCSGLTDLDLSSFNTSKATSMSQMFQNCSNLSTLKASNTTWIIGSNTSKTNMWLDCKIQEPTHYL